MNSYGRSLNWAIVRYYTGSPICQYTFKKEMHKKRKEKIGCQIQKILSGTKRRKKGGREGGRGRGRKEGREEGRKEGKGKEIESWSLGEKRKIE